MEALKSRLMDGHRWSCRRREDQCEDPDEETVRMIPMCYYEVMMMGS